MLTKKELKSLIKQQCIDLGADSDRNTIDILYYSIVEKNVSLLDQYDCFLLGDVLEEIIQDYPEFKDVYMMAWDQWFSLTNV